MEIADLLQLRDSGSSAVDSTNANERNRQFNRILIALGALGTAFGTSFIGGAPTAATGYTPVLSSGTGTFTSAAVTGQYLTVGKFTYLRLTIVITTNGAAATSAIVTLPATASATGGAVMSGHGSTGNMLQGVVATGGTTVTITNYDNTYPGADGRTLVLSGWYENA